MHYTQNGGLIVCHAFSSIFRGTKSFRQRTHVRTLRKRHRVHLMVSFITVFATLSIVTFTVNTATLIGTIIHYVLLFAISVFTGLLSSGTAYFYLKIVTGQHATANDLFCGFRMYTDKALTVQAWISLITYLCSLPEYIVLYRMSERPDAAALTIYGLCMLLSGIVALLLAVFYAPAFSCSMISRSILLKNCLPGAGS